MVRTPASSRVFGPALASSSVVRYRRRWRCCGGDPARLLEHRVGDATRGTPGTIVLDGRLQREPRAFRIVFLLLGIAVERGLDIGVADRQRFVDRLPRASSTSREQVAVPKPQPVVKYEMSSITSPGPTFKKNV